MRGSPTVPEEYIEGRSVTLRFFRAPAGSRRRVAHLLLSTFAIFRRTGRALWGRTPVTVQGARFLEQCRVEPGSSKRPGPYGGTTGSSISALLLLHDTVFCIASSSRLDLGDPDVPSLTAKWRNSRFGASSNNYLPVPSKPSRCATTQRPRCRRL